MSVVGFVNVNAQSMNTIYTNSYQDCVKLSAMFDTTFSTHQSGIYQSPYTPEGYEVVTCSNVGTCPDGIARSSCSWQRYLQVLCMQPGQLAQGSPSYIFVFSNGAPDHCYYGKQNSFTASDINYNTYAIASVFNLATRDMSTATGLESTDYFYNRKVMDQTDIDTMLCDGTWASSSSIDKNIGYSEAIGKKTPSNTHEDFSFNEKWAVKATQYPLATITESNSIVGISLNGVFIFSAAASSYNSDVFFSNRGKTAYNFDLCLGSQETFRTYRYHSFSPCIYDMPALREKSGQCSEEANCKLNPIKYGIDRTPDVFKGITPIGVARDGRVIYGPYRGDKQLWQPCDVDICNGMQFGNFYVYVATVFFPYTIGCWGPGNRGDLLTPSCTSNARLCSNAYMGMSALLASIASVSFLIFNSLF
eukprot:403335042